MVADLVASAHRASAYEVFAAGLGIAIAVGGGPTGWLYAVSTGALAVTAVAIQLVAVAGMLKVRLRPATGSGTMPEAG